MILIQNAHIMPIVGPELPNGCLLAEDGRITAVAPHIDAPEGCTVIDADGRLLTPGCVEAHCHIGLDNECLRWEGMDYNEIVDPLTPQLRAIDSINPQDGAFPNALRGGVTTACTGPGSANVVGGTFTVLKLAGKRVDNMLLKEPAAMKCAFGENPKGCYGQGLKKSPMTRMAVAALLRELLFKTRRYRDDKLAGKNPAFDMKLEAMLPVINGEIPLKCHAHRADDILTAVRIAKEFGVKGDVWLEARNLNEAGVLHDVSFKAHAGQITGFAGLVGAGRTETMRAVFGADKLDSGEIYVKGEKVHIRTPKDAIKRKIAFLTEDRKGQGLVLNLDVRTNLVLANMKGFSNGPFLDKDRIEQAGNDNVSALKIKTPSLNEVVGQLSGGNQQKVVIGKWVNTDADIFIFDEPTRGIDVGAKIEVYRVMNDLVKAGKCVIMVSSELPEILAMSDHVVVMRGGRVMADIDRDTPHFNSEDIMKAAWGGELD